MLASRYRVPLAISRDHHLHRTETDFTYSGLVANVQYAGAWYRSSRQHEAEDVCPFHLLGDREMLKRNDFRFCRLAVVRLNSSYSDFTLHSGTQLFTVWHLTPARF